MENKYDQIISDQIDIVLKNNTFGQDFKFIEGQRKVITTVCSQFLKWINNPEEVNSVIINAPTGYGKSVLAMFISKVLQELKYKGYILTVDLALQQQYEADFKKFKLPFSSIKGTDNYKCHVNSEPFSKGDCRQYNMSYIQLAKLPCYSKCSYLQSRNKAIASSISLINYNYWLIQRNKTVKEGMQVPFPQRDFTIFDEAHKLDSIIQSYSSIKLEKELPYIISSLNSNLNNVGYDLQSRVDTHEIKEVVDILIKSNSKEEILKNLIELKEILFVYVDQKDKIRLLMDLQIKQGETITDEWNKINFVMERCNELYSSLVDYINVANDIGLKNIIKRPGEEITEFCSLKEDFLIKKYVLQQSGFCVLMSATYGNISQFAKIIGLKKTIALRLNSLFDYTNSPIYYSTKFF